MERYATGDEPAVGELYDLLEPKLTSFLLRQTHNRAVTDDLVQQTFLNIHCARSRFQPGSDVLPWAFAIARRLLIDEARRNKRLVLEGGKGDGAEERDPPSRETPELGAQSHELAESLNRELARMPESQRTAFELIRHDGLSVAEAAEVLGTSVNAVKLRVHRAYEAMRTVIRANAAEGEPSR